MDLTRLSEEQIRTIQKRVFAKQCGAISRSGFNRMRSIYCRMMSAIQIVRMRKDMDEFTASMRAIERKTIEDIRRAYDAH